MDDPDLPTSYDRVAAEYARRIFDELQYKPLDRALLDRFAGRVHGRGPVCDMGCGPGQVARYLHERGVDAFGVDLSPGMLEQARALNPGIPFRLGDMLALDVPASSWAGIAAFYSIIHVPRPQIPQALGEFRRVLQPEGLLLLAFHVGQETVHLDEWWGERVSVDFAFLEPDEVASRLSAAGFIVEDVIRREPYPEVEHPSKRAYIFARAPAA